MHWYDKETTKHFMRTTLLQYIYIHLLYLFYFIFLNTLHTHTKISVKPTGQSKKIIYTVYIYILDFPIQRFHELFFSEREEASSFNVNLLEETKNINLINKFLQKKNLKLGTYNTVCMYVCMYMCTMYV